MPKIIMNEFAKRNKYLIYIDENLLGLEEQLKKLDYNSFTFPQGTSDDSISIFLNNIRKKTKEKPIIFIMDNYKDFINFDRQYFMIEVKKEKYTKEKLANKLNQIFISNNEKKGFPDSFSISI